MINESFFSQGVIGAVERYNPSDRHELALKVATLDFVLTHPDFYRRSLKVGHTTASAWIIDHSREYVLLTNHATLNLWMQLGGHIESDFTIQDAAMREAREESGLTSISLISPNIFDIDIHEIPESSKAQAHLHYDIRFLFSADRSEPLIVSSESKDLAWIRFDDVPAKTTETSVLRMLDKSRSLHSLP